MSDQDNIDQKKLSFIREARRFLRFVQNPTWCASDELTDEEHVEEFRKALAKTREQTSLPERTKMNSVRDTDTGLVLAMVGNTPNADQRARFIAGILASMPFILDEFEHSLNIEIETDSEICALKATVRSLQVREKWLMEAIAHQMNDPDSFKDMPEVA